MESCRLLRQYFDRPAITTDLICGFAGETEEEFAETLAMIETADFSAMHIFPYSRRSGTVADRMPDQLPNAVKDARCHQAAAVGAKPCRCSLKKKRTDCGGDTPPTMWRCTPLALTCTTC